MFWKSRPDLIEQWYFKLDDLIGKIDETISTSNNKDTQIIILSDHGFKNFDYKVNLNKWLIDQGYLSVEKETGDFSLDNINWNESKVYALGLNSLYINKFGREGAGQVKADEIPNLLKEIKNRLFSWQGPDGKNIVKSVFSNEEIIQGPISDAGPDMLVGYSPGYRASADTGLGKWNEEIIEPNTDHWGADHCIDPGSVQGVIFRNKGLANYPDPSYLDIPPMIVKDTLKPGSPSDSDFSDEDRETVEERLKGLGYL
jgi:predicted AlkP superfamily phosphohydrolase/phosphomutase